MCRRLRLPIQGKFDWWRPGRMLKSKMAARRVGEGAHLAYETASSAKHRIDFERAEKFCGGRQISLIKSVRFYFASPTVTHRSKRSWRPDTVRHSPDETVHCSIDGGRNLTGLVRYFRPSICRDPAANDRRWLRFSPYNSRMTLPSTMRAARLHRFGEPLRVESVPTPILEPGHLIVCVRACGVCHTDLHACLGDWRAKARLPLVPGHEIVGDVVAVGEGVNERAVGDRVGVFWLNSTCQACEYCRDGWESVCPGQVNTGFGVPGGFAEYVSVGAQFAVPVPRELKPESAAPLLCAGVSSFKAIRETELKPGDTLAIVGCGGVGHLAVAYARAMGLRVVAIDASDTALSLAREFGADEAVNTADVAALKRWKKTGVAGSLITAGHLDAIRLGVDLLRRRGTAVIVGLPPGEMSLPVFDVVVKRFTIRGSIGGTRTDVAGALELAVTANIQPRVTVRDLAEINQVFDDLSHGRVTGRVVLRTAYASA